QPLTQRRKFLRRSVPIARNGEVDGSLAGVDRPGDKPADRSRWGAALDAILCARPRETGHRRAQSHHNRAWVATCVTASALAGCAPVGPDFLRPAAIVSP